MLDPSEKIEIPVSLLEKIFEELKHQYSISYFSDQLACFQDRQAHQLSNNTEELNSLIQEVWSLYCREVDVKRTSTIDFDQALTDLLNGKYNQEEQE